VTDYAIFMLDVNGIVTSWNAGAQRIAGYAANEIIGQHFDLYPAAPGKAVGPSTSCRSRDLALRRRGLARPQRTARRCGRRHHHRRDPQGVCSASC
jgi:PAS domain S-box-containing protein